MDLAIVTCANLPEPDPDAQPLAEALRSAGIRSELLAWDDPRADWSRARMTLLRSPWNYPLHALDFLTWAEAAARVSSLWNPLHVVRWNLHKSYLSDLEQLGIPVTPTALLTRGCDAALRAIVEDHGWTEVVVKPAVSVASFKTRRFGLDAIDDGERHLRQLLAERDVLVQPYLPSVGGYGERALVWIDGELTHAVRKAPRFDGQDESVSAAVEIAEAEVALARQVFDAIEGPVLYGRVDTAPGFDGRPVVMEVELIEPSLFFPQSPSALARFVSAIARELSRLSG